jgi:hypothetical protein
MLLAGNLQMLFPPDSFDSLVINVPTNAFQRSMHTWTPIPWLTMGNTSHLGKQLTLIHRPTTLVTLCRTRLTEYTTSSTL